MRTGAEAGLALVKKCPSFTPGIVGPRTSTLVLKWVDLECAQVLKQGWPQA